jgi:colanic acid/amylovoran biosynthesis glycosyltransferase
LNTKERSAAERPAYAAKPTRSQPRMRVAYFAEIFPTGSETWIHHEIRELIRSGCDVRVFATRPRSESAPAENDDMVALTTYLPEITKGSGGVRNKLSLARVAAKLFPGILFDCTGIRQRAQAVRAIFQIDRFLERLDAFNPDVVHVHFGATRANLALIYHLLRGTPFFVKMHASDVWTRVGLFRLKVDRSAGIFITSQAGVDYVNKKNPDVNSSHISGQMVGVPVDKFTRVPARDGSGTPVFLTVARLVAMKGLHVLLDASAVLKGRGLAHRIVIIGDGPERARLLEQRRRLGLDDVVDFRGYGTPADVRNALASAAAFVLPCIWDEVEQTQDGMPIALMEAMASGVPVVSTTVAGIPELIEDGHSGYLVAPSDANALAGALERVCHATKHERERLITNARTAIVEEFNTTKVTAQLIQAFETAHQGRRGTQHELEHA